MEDDYYFHMGPYGGSLGHVFIEEDREGPEYIGLLDAYGKKIFRCPVPGPIRVGFPTKPEDNLGFDQDPENEFYYGMEH